MPPTKRATLHFHFQGQQEVAARNGQLEPTALLERQGREDMEQSANV